MTKHLEFILKALHGKAEKSFQQPLIYESEEEEEKKKSKAKKYGHKTEN